MYVCTELNKEYLMNRKYNNEVYVCTELNKEYLMNRKYNNEVYVYTELNRNKERMFDDLTFLTYSFFASWSSDRDASAIFTICLVSDFH